MNNTNDASIFEADNFLQPQRYPDGPDSSAIRKFVREAINEGLIIPVAIDPNG